MTRILDLGTRIELVSMYPHFHDISIALYERKLENGDFEFQTSAAIHYVCTTTHNFALAGTAPKRPHKRALSAQRTFTLVAVFSNLVQKVSWNVSKWCYQMCDTSYILI